MSHLTKLSKLSLPYVVSSKTAVVHG